MQIAKFLRRFVALDGLMYLYLPAEVNISDGGVR